MMYQGRPIVTLLAALAVNCVDSATTFFYNDDAQCGYPFSAFQVKQITCAKSQTLYVDGAVQLSGEQYQEGEYGNNYNYVNNNSNGGSDHQKEDGECAFGDDMMLTGSVTLDEAMYAQFDVKIKICFGDSTSSWYNSKKCVKKTSSIDMRPSTYQYNEENLYLEAGSHDFSATVTIPGKSFTFREGYQVTTYVSFYPKKNYASLYQNGYNPYNNDIASYKYKTDCVATFAAGQDYEVQYSNVYGAAGVAAAAAVLLAAAGITVQRRRRRQSTSISTEGMVPPPATDFKTMPEMKIIGQLGVRA